MEVAFSRPYFVGTEAEALAEVIASRWVTQGPRVEAFERAWADRCGAEHAVAVSNCTTAMHLVMETLGIGAGDEVIVPSLSFIATANAVRHTGATPVFADVDPTTYNLDPAAAEDAIGPRTAAIMPVHQIGLPADIDAFQALADRHGLALVEDAACAVGAAYDGRAIGGDARPACFSLHARKIVTTGDGGMITTHDGELAARLRRQRHQGMSVSDLARHRSSTMLFESFEETGYNFRMTDLQAAVGLCQLDVLAEILAARRAVAERYTEVLAGLAHVTPPAEPARLRHTYQSYMVRLAPGAPVARDELLQRMLDDGIATRRGIMATHREPAYADAAPADLPVTEAIADDSFLLPIFPELPQDEQEYVLDRLAHHLGESR